MAITSYIFSSLADWRLIGRLASTIATGLINLLQASGGSVYQQQVLLVGGLMLYNLVFKQLLLQVETCVAAGTGNGTLAAATAAVRSVMGLVGQGQALSPATLQALVPLVTQVANGSGSPTATAFSQVGSYVPVPGPVLQSMALLPREGYLLALSLHLCA